MDDDLTKLEQMLRTKAAEVPYLQEAPSRLLARARRRVARNALSAVLAVVVIVVGASAGLAALGAFRETENLPGHSSTPADDTSCTATMLRATAALEGAAGSVVGAIDLTNAGPRACTLRGHPGVTLTGFDAQELSPSVVEVPPQWQVDGSQAPKGWPVVLLDAGETASIRVRWSNPCPQLTDGVSWHIDLSGGGGELDVSGADATPPCLGSQQPSTLEIGPYEPAAVG